MKKLHISLDRVTKKNVYELHVALKQLGLNVADEEMSGRSLGQSTEEAVKSLQEKNALDATGRLNLETLNAIDTELFDVHHTLNKPRTEKLQGLLEILGVPVAKEEKNHRKVGDSTRDAIKRVQDEFGLPADGRVSETFLDTLNDRVIKKRFSTKTQIGKLQISLKKISTIAKLNIELDPDELKRKELGPTSEKLIKAFQTKYKLPATGELNKATFDKMDSVSGSQGNFVKKLKAPPARELKTVTQTLRLNMVSPQVSEMQKGFAYLGFKISEKEFKTQTFGKTTVKAIKKFQKENGLVETGHFDKATSKLVNSSITKVNPNSGTAHRYRIRGSVRDELWKRKNAMVIKVFEKILDQESPEPLTAKKNFLNGFFDLPYNAPINPVNGRIKDKFHLVVKLYEMSDQQNPVAIQTHYNVKPIHWVNFTQSKNANGEIEYNGKYAGPSDFEVTGSILQKAIGDAEIINLHETETDKEITQLSLQTGLSTDDIMRHILCRKVARSVNRSNPLGAEVFYAFIRQNLPADLPDDLMRGTSDWETIDQLTEIAGSGIVFLDNDTQEQAIVNALEQNLVSRKIAVNKSNILGALESQRSNFILTKPILIENGNLQSLLGKSKIEKVHYSVVAEAFINNKGVNASFWDEIKAQDEAQKLNIGVDAITDFATTIEAGNISKNHIPTVTFLKSQIGSQPDKQFKKIRHIAKLSREGFVDLINQNGKQVPDNIPGDTDDEKVANFAVAMKQRADQSFPTDSLLGAIRRSGTTKLKKFDEVESFLDEHDDLNFRRQNLDQFLKDKPAMHSRTREELKIVQRVHKLSVDPSIGAALIDEGLHSSRQVYFAGKNKIKTLLEGKGIEERRIDQMYETSKMQYLQILARLADFRPEIQKFMPAFIIPHTYSKKEIQDALGDIPNLETLFGSMDFCECDHCKSLYSPSAYLTDMLRFLSAHEAVDNNKTVKDILFERRPDLGNIKLNCVNTDTPLPYIDLVCEILENWLIGNKDFVYQTTLSRQELRAIPEYVQTGAYTTLAAADFPMNVSFNLWQEETRTYLIHLRVPRFEIMEAFQDKSDSNNKKPNDAAIAAEFFGLSSKEKDLIVTERQTAVDQNKYWGFDTNQTTIPVKLFMERTKLSYHELLELLMVRWVNDPDTPPASVIERPFDTCDTGEQNVLHLSLPRFDLMHRFIRLWRKTEWKMWELDLLIRNPKIGNKVLNDDTLTHLKQFKQIQARLRLPFETLLAFYGDINREIRIDPVKSDVLIQPLYNKLFQNRAATNPVDAEFKALDENHAPIPLDSTIALQVNEGAPHNGYTPVPTILSALTLNQAEFDLLAGKTNKQLSVESLSIIARYAYLSRSLRLRMTELLLFLDVTNNADPFTSLQVTLDSLKYLEDIKTSGLSIREIDYALNYNPDSPIGLRDESIAQLTAALRNILLSNKQKVEELQLTDADRDAILTFDADGLVPMTDVELAAALTPLTDILKDALEKFIAAAFSVEETNFIISFDPTSTTAVSKANLVAQITAVQENLVRLLGSNENQIKSHVANSFGLTDEQATIILEKLVVSPGPETLLAKLADESLIAKNAEGEHDEINSTNFPGHFNAYTLLHKVSLIVSKMKIETKDIDWFMVNFASVNTLDFSALPFAAASPNVFDKWHNLYLFLQYKSKFPEPENASIRSILALAGDPAHTKEEIFAEIAKLTQWDSEQISSIHDGLKTQHAADHLDYTDAKLYHRLLKCFQQMKLTGVNATTMFTWSQITNDTTDDIAVALQTRQAVKSKYEQDDWLDKATSLHDEIREKKRFALVGYLLEHSQRNEDPELENRVITNPLYWVDASSLYKYFLIDVEMSACQLTSRMKQALSSTQLFVQRCFLNLEKRYVEVTQDQKEDASSPNAWSQWKWMKNYRIWEANRKIFFYPENWLEPELRDDKSPFFEDLESELLQNEVTKENVEAAFQNYLHKVDEVSRLEVCGMYHEMEDLDLNEAGYERNIVHVIGRTMATPNIYYYRTYDMNYSTWSAWEKVDVDITGDHVTPVVYNRKLHLFWLQFMDKPMKVKKIPAAKPTTGPTESPEPMKLLEVQLGWTVKKSSGWTSKKISKQKLIHPWERPHFSYNLKPWYLAKTNELYLDIYLSTSKEFNDGKFYDPNKLLNPSGSVYGSIFERFKNPTYLTKNRFNETYLPWHSSSFVFNGEIKDVKLKGLGGQWDYFGEVHWGDDSYDYVHENFSNDGEAIKELDPKLEYGPRLKLPNGMHFHSTHLTNNRRDAKNNRYLRVLEHSNTATLLSGALSPFELVIAQQDLQLNTMTSSHPMFYQDNQRAFFIKPEWETRLDNYGRMLSQTRKYRFAPFYHPYTTLFLRELNRDGVDGLLNRGIQVRPQSYAPKNTFNFSSYLPTSDVIVGDDHPAAQKWKDIVDFSFGGSQSIYNWELFFHGPLMVANLLMQNQKFEDAMHWFHYIFDPTNIEKYPTPQRYWVTKPFFEYNSDDYRKQRIESILSNLNLSENSEQLKAGRNNPFNPHIIARYRPVAYQKNVVMKYLDNLIAWADMLFKRDSIESINEASLLYMLAYEILGDRPQNVPHVKHEEFTFNELETRLDEFGNARVDIILEDTLLPITVVPSASGTEPMPDLETSYFCIPHNDFLSKYWDTVEDRLFKIRHCMNIQGIVRQLPLFEPPIDPALLIKAAAAGMDLGSVLNDLSAPTPYYRFRIVVQKATDFCNEVKILGEKLLSALEKKDVEALSLLRSQHEIELLEAIKEVRKKQIDEAVETIGSFNVAMELADARKAYFESIPRMNTWEDFGAIAHGLGIASDIGATIAHVLAAGIYLIPQFPTGAAGFGGTPMVLVEYGGDQPGKAAAKFGAFFEGLSKIAHSAGSMLETQGNYDRRDAENMHQGNLATIEKNQIQFQINAAMIRQAIAEKELENQELQIENSKSVDDYMRNKFSNDKLYSWMITQISTVYFQAYQLAFDMAKKAEKCYQHELGISDSNIVQFGYWDSLKKGLLSGDKLMGDLRKLEAEYINQNKREFEITKHISLAQMFPLSLITLKETGEGTLSLPEWIFDMDYPGHYMRRIKSVSLSIPCVVGPYTGVNCTLSLLKNETRMDATLSGGGYEKVADDTRFRTMFGTISSIATSHAQNDSGMFELNFNDERYLPFEGAGVISDWKIILPIENNYFDFASLSDVILHISYTSRQGGGALAIAANTAFQKKLPNQTARLFSLKHEFSTEWHRFLNPEGNNDQEFVIDLRRENYPYFIRGKIGTLKIKSIYLFVESSLENDFIANLKVPNTDFENNLVVGRDGNFNNVRVLHKDYDLGSFPDSLGKIRIKIKENAVTDFKSLVDNTIDDIFMLLQLEHEAND